VQAPILAAQTRDDAVIFASMMKEVNTACRATSRIAFTGSGMISLLNTLRKAAPNGYTLWGAMARVHLGATPPPASVLAMATAILDFRAASSMWPAAVSALVTPEYVIQLLTPAAGAARLTSPRPALVAYMADAMGTADVGSAETVAAAAFRELQRKLTEETREDSAVALKELTLQQRIMIYSLATGGRTRSSLLGLMGEEDSFMELLDSVCQPPSPNGNGSVHLLAPYPALLGAILDSNGTLLVEWTGKEWRVHELLGNRLKFFGEHATEVMKLAGKPISAAVMERLAANGVGTPWDGGAEPFRPPATFAELQLVPAVKAIFSVLNAQEVLKNGCESPSFSAFNRAATAAARSPSSAAAFDLWHAGVHILRWLRHIEAHVYISKIALVDSGLSISLVERVCADAVRAWETAGNSVTAGIPVVRPPLGAPSFSPC
jgi:hypothetical protein